MASRAIKERNNGRYRSRAQRGIPAAACLKHIVGALAAICRGARIVRDGNIGVGDSVLFIAPADVFFSCIYKIYRISRRHISFAR